MLSSLQQLKIKRITPKIKRLHDCQGNQHLAIYGIKKPNQSWKTNTGSLSEYANHRSKAKKSRIFICQSRFNEMSGTIYLLTTFL